MNTNMRTILNVDALVSAAAGLVMALGAELLSGFTGLPEPLLKVAGFSLGPWTVALLWLARQPAIPRNGVMTVIAVNVAWVLASVAVLFAVSPTALGYAFVIAQAVTVGLFAELQFFALRRETRAA